MMNKKVFLDLETTGLDPYSSRIIEIAMIAQYGEETITRCERMNPGVPIPASATAIHGITDEMVADFPGFDYFADGIQSLIDGALIIGYNSRSFDVPFLHAELVRADRPGFPTDEHGAIAIQEIDLLRVWRQTEPRNLTTAARRFARVCHDDAHGAQSDASVLLGVMEGMMDEFSLKSLDDMIALTAPENAVDRDGKFARNEHGKFIFAFGKHQGQPVSRNLSYVEWMLKQSFSPETKSWCTRFMAWGKGEGQP